MKPLGHMLRIVGAVLLAALMLPCSVVGQTTVPRNHFSEQPNFANLAALGTCDASLADRSRVARDTAIEYSCFDIDEGAGVDFQWVPVGASLPEGLTEGAVLVASASGGIGEFPNNLSFSVSPPDATLFVRGSAAGQAAIALASDAGVTPHGLITTGDGLFASANRDMYLSSFRGSGALLVNRLRIANEGVSVGRDPLPTPKDLLYVHGSEAEGITIEGFGGGASPSLTLSMGDVKKFTVGAHVSDGDAFKIGTTGLGVNTRFKIDSAGAVTIPGALSAAGGAAVIGGVCIESTDSGCAAGAGELIVEGCTTFGPSSSAPSGIACDRYFDTDNAEWCCHNGTNWFECDDNVTSCS